MVLLGLLNALVPKQIVEAVTAPTRKAQTACRSMTIPRCGVCEAVLTVNSTIVAHPTKGTAIQAVPIFLRPDLLKGPST